jgi:hypothetical protein
MITGVMTILSSHTSLFKKEEFFVLFVTQGYFLQYTFLQLRVSTRC